MIKKLFLSLNLIILAVFCMACSDENVMQDGYYSAQMQNEYFGWYEFVTITVKNNEIVATEFNAKNDSGFIKSWDNAYMKNMNSISGTYPNEYTRKYAAQLTEKQSDDIDTLTGATSSGENFKLLAKAVIEQAKKGDSSVVFVSGGELKE